MKTYKVYKYRVYPNREQKVLLSKHFGACRYVYNYGLERCIKYYAETNKYLSRYALQKEITEMKQQEETVWLKEINAQSLQIALINLDSAFTKFFKDRKGFPKFKAKHASMDSVGFHQKTRVDFEDDKLYVLKFSEGIKCKFHRRFDGIIRRTTINRTKTDKYFVSIVVEENREEVIKQSIDINTSVGIDLGIKSFLVTSVGDKFDNPKYLYKSLKKLRREQRRLSRKVKGSNNRNKQKVEVAKVYEKISNQRSDFLHKITKQLINENQVNTYCLEDLNIQGMVQNRRLSRSISDVGWGMFVSYLIYKAEYCGKNIIRIGRFEPSSKICSCCGFINNELTLNDREWLCIKCGTEHDRDINAAINIRNIAFMKNRVGTTQI